MPDTVFAVIAQGLGQIAEAAKLSAEVVADAADEVEDSMSRVNRASDQSDATRDFSSTISGRGGPGEGIKAPGYSLSAMTLTPENLVNAINRARETAK